MNFIEKRTQYIEDKLRQFFKEDDVFWNNEIRANLFVSQMLVVLIVVLLIGYILNIVGIFDVPRYEMNITLLINIPLLLSGVVLSAVYKGQKRWLKYALCIIAQFTAVSLCSILNIFVALIVAIPVVLSVRYYSRNLTIVISILTTIGMAVCTLTYGFSKFIDLNLVPSIQGTYQVVEGSGLREAILDRGYDFKRYILYLYEGSFAPRFLLFIIIAAVCTELASRARSMVIEQNEISKKTASIKTELSMATAIQGGVLPKEFPPFPDHKEFDIFATMAPAKEVGGDFYDFFLIDEDHLGLVVADVSGKGIPAALFMMVSKILIKTHATNGLSPSDVVAAVNAQLCSDNKTDMFVTLWYGVLEIPTGRITYVDAGHEYPVLKRANGNFEMIKDKKSFVIGGMENVLYKENELWLEPGDKLFLYTDGVPEATDSENALFGCDRMVDALNANKSDGVKEIIGDLRASVDAFVKDAPQFDDITMLAIEYNGK